MYRHLAYAAPFERVRGGGMLVYCLAASRSTHHINVPSVNRDAGRRVNVRVRYTCEDVVQRTSFFPILRLQLRR